MQVLATVSDRRGALSDSDHLEGRAGEMPAQARSMKLEGIICKRRDAPYRSGRGKTWLKLKCERGEVFVALGFTPPVGSRTGLGSLQLGDRTEAGALEYAGGVGCGFPAQELGALRGKLDALTTPGLPDAMVLCRRSAGPCDHVGVARTRHRGAVDRVVRVRTHPARDLIPDSRGPASRRDCTRERRSRCRASPSSAAANRRRSRVRRAR